MSSKFPDFMHMRGFSSEHHSPPVRLDESSLASYLGGLATLKSLDNLTLHISIDDIELTRTTTPEDCRVGMYDAVNATVTVYPQCLVYHSSQSVEAPEERQEHFELEYAHGHAVLAGFRTEHIYCRPMENNPDKIKARLD